MLRQKRGGLDTGLAVDPFGGTDQKQVRQSLLILCLTAFAVIDLFRFVYSLETDRVLVILNLCLSTCFAIGFDVIIAGDSHLFHIKRCLSIK